MKPKVRLPIYQTKVWAIPLYWFSPQAGGRRARWRRPCGCLSWLGRFTYSLQDGEMIGDSPPGDALRSADTPRWGQTHWDEHHDERRRRSFPRLALRPATRTTRRRLWIAFRAWSDSWTAGGEIQFVNRRVLKYTGRTQEELRHWATSDIVHPEDLPQVIQVFSQSISSGSWSEIEQRLRRSDGVYRWFQHCGSPLRDAAGNVVRWCVLLTDVDERKRAEDALRESERAVGTDRR